MGALHAGHFSLLRIAQRRADRVIVSIFVNPTQFAPQRRPRRLSAHLCPPISPRSPSIKADLVWAPSVAAMYPEGFATQIVPEGPAKAGLEDAFRPHFFAGVATVVAKLLIQCEPDFALFGEKDFQQLKVVTRLARDLGLKTRIVGAPIVREADGLALSSRNRFLSRRTSARQRRRFTACLRTARKGSRPAARSPPCSTNGRAAIVRAGFALDYLEARNAETLAPVAAAADKDEPIRLLVAARIGRTRLIDNIGV